MSQKRPLDAVAPEQDEAPPSPTKKLRRTGQMVRQVQFDMAKLFVLLMVLVARLSSMETLLLDLPNALQRLMAEQFGALQRSFMGSIEENIRSVLHKEMQERQEASLPNDVHDPSRQITEGFPDTGGISRVVKLRFVDAERPKDPLYTGCPVQWQNVKQAKVAIFENERQIMQGNLSKLQIEILPVHADFFTERGQEDFTEEELNKHIHMYKGKESVLTTVTLRNGEAYLGSFFFTESSYRKKLRLVARVKRQDLAVRVHEAITDPFVVKDRRSESNEKSYPPSKEDAVHRLEKISLKGKRCNDLAGNNITTVKHLMRRYHRDKSGLQKLTGMKKEDWSTMIKHATTSDPGNEIYSYRVEEENCELLFNDFYDLVGMMINGFYVPYSVGDIDQFRQIKVNNWKMSAHKKFEELENSVGLLPDYFMSNGLPVRDVLPNSDASTTIQTRTTWQCSNDMIHNKNLASENDLSSLTTDALGTCPVTELGQHHSPAPQNGTPYYPTAGNTLNGQGPFSGQPTIQSHILLAVPGASLIDQQNGYLSSSMSDAPGTSYPVTDGVIQGTSSPNHVLADILSGLSPTELQEWLELPAHLAYQGFVQPNDEELPNPYYQLDEYEQDGGNQ